MNEDDTFRILTRVSFQEMRSRIGALGGPEKVPATLAEGGWLIEEYLGELNRIAESRKAAMQPVKPVAKEKFRIYNGFGVMTRDPKDNLP